MIEKDTTILKQYTNPLSRSIQEQYAISRITTGAI